VVLCLCVIPSHGGIIDILNSLVKANLPKLNDLLHQNIPDSYGNCKDNNPTGPCLCSPNCANLYYIHKSWEYEAYARWIEGLQTGNITSIVFSDAGTVITVDIMGFFANLPLSLWVGECATFNKCVKIWDNTAGCCGTNKHFQANITVDCQNTYPYLNNIKLSELVLDHFEITEKIIGININIKDITDTVEAAMSGLITQYITTDAFINYNGTKITLLEFANIEIQTETHGFFECPTTEKKKDIIFL